MISHALYHAVLNGNDTTEPVIHSYKERKNRTERNGTERNGTERKGKERNGTEFIGTSLENG